MGTHIFSSSPVNNFGIGPYTFEKGLLTFNDDEAAAKFEELLDSLPIGERRIVTKIDVAAAENVLAQANISRTTKDFDSSLGLRDLEQLKRDQGVVGTTLLEEQQRLDGEPGGPGEIRPENQLTVQELTAMNAGAGDTVTREQPVTRPGGGAEELQATTSQEQAQIEAQKQAEETNQSPAKPNPLAAILKQS